MPVGTTASHIHAGAVGVGGPVIINFTVPAGGISNDFGLSGTFGCSDVTVRAPQGINSCEDFEQALLLEQHLRERPLDGESGRRDPRTADSRGRLTVHGRFKRSFGSAA